MKKKLIIILPIVIAFLVFVGVYYYLNYTDERTNLTVGEKRWIAANSETKYDLEIINDIPVYSIDGSGVVFNFIKNFEVDTGLEFNKIPYPKTAKPSGTGLRFRLLDNDTKPTNKDLLMFEDGYVAISKKEVRYDEISELDNKTIGVFTSDVGELSYYLKTATDLTYKTYDNITTMMSDFEKDTIEMIILPQILYLEQTVINDGYHINYYFTEISKRLVLTLSDDNQELNQVVRKYYEKWRKENYISVYNKAYLDYYAAKNGINDKAKADLVSKSYVYGYIENAPYELNIDGVPNGIASEYIARMLRLTGIDFTYKKYKSMEELNQAIDRGEVDIYFNNSGYNTSDYKATISPTVEEYVVLGVSKEKDIVTTFESLKNKDVKMLKSNLITKYFSENSKANIKEVNSIDQLTKGSGLVIVDKEIYNYYRNNKFSKYEVLYSNFMNYDYTFMVYKENEEFYKLFNYIITTNSYYNYRLSGLNALDLSLVERTSFEELYLIVLGLVLLPIVIAVACLVFFKRKKKITEVRKEDRRKYTDILTSLKNRNYLNLNMEAWEDSQVYPQAILIVDLNNVKYVNDNYGHEAGDNLIVSAASILVNTQLENSEIIRTDGNEFLIYLVGYSEKQVETYCKKLTKEMKDLPHGFGAAIGYSMIIDDIKTIDDAINEATLDMRTTKEKVK
ncbi:MAG: GGDEF domain-containing protein [Bacilli bacterium]|nr:GGDEF domain-containing protein [Bacilli bacterium]